MYQECFVLLEFGLVIFFDSPSTFLFACTSSILPLYSNITPGKNNYAGSASLRCNFDFQDLRRVLPEEHWLTSEEEMPHIGDRPDWGYMNHYEWDGNQYVLRKRAEGADLADQPMQWDLSLIHISEPTRRTPI